MNAIPGKIFWTVTCIITISAVLFLIQSAYRRYKFSSEISRKIAHITVGLVSLIFIRLIDDIYIIGMISLGTFVLLLLTKMKDGLESIHKTERKSIGSVVYPLPIFICYAVALRENSQLYLYLPLLTFILADPAAASVGLSLGWKPYRIWNEKRTISGSMAFFISTVLISLVVVNIHAGAGFLDRFWILLLIALPATLIESVSPRGSDNLTVPLAQLILIRLVLI